MLSLSTRSVASLPPRVGAMRARRELCIVKLWFVFFHAFYFVWKAFFQVWRNRLGCATAPVERIGVCLWCGYIRGFVACGSTMSHLRASRTRFFVFSLLSALCKKVSTARIDVVFFKWVDKIWISESWFCFSRLAQALFFYEDDHYWVDGSVFLRNRGTRWVKCGICDDWNRLMDEKFDSID